MNIKRNILLRTRFIIGVGILVAGGICYQLLWVQLRGVSHFPSQQRMQQHISLVANRGNIYADDGSLLATSLPFYKLAIDPSISNEWLFDKHIDSLSWYLSNFFNDVSARQYKSRIVKARKAGSRYLLLHTKEVGHADKLRMSKWPLVRAGRLQGGIIFEKYHKRFLPFGALGVRTIGHVNWQDKGIVGLEHSFDKVLIGQPGRVLVEKGREGRWLPIYDGSEIHPKHGLDIETTLNVNIQEVAQRALHQALVLHAADYGAVVVMEVKTGEIKAMANLKRNKKGKYQAKYNYAVGSQGMVEPGSTLKLASILALLEKSDLKLMDTLQTGGGEFNFYGETMRDAKKGGWGLITARDAFEQSSNIGIARAVMKHFGNRPQVFLDYLFNELHLNEPLGFQIKGEGMPYIKTPADTSWSGTTLAWMSHGYELRLSPLQLLVLYNAVANDGRMLAPLLVKRILNEDKKIETFSARLIKARIASPENLQAVRSLLEGVILRGTAQNIRSDYYQAAGKTGTAKKYKDGHYTDAYYSSFVGYFPANKPMYSCIVVVDYPKNGQGHGAEVAAPVFKQIADRISRQYIDFAFEQEKKDIQLATQGAERLPKIGGGISKELKYLCNKMHIPHMWGEQIDISEEQSVRTYAAGQKVAYRPYVVNDRLPDVRGLPLRDALYLLENNGYKVKKMGNGPRIQAQYPFAGTSLRKGSLVKLALK